MIRGHCVDLLFKRKADLCELNFSQVTRRYACLLKAQFQNF